MSMTTQSDVDDPNSISVTTSDLHRESNFSSVESLAHIADPIAQVAESSDSSSSISAITTSVLSEIQRAEGLLKTGSEVPGGATFGLSGLESKALQQLELLRERVLLLHLASEQEETSEETDIKHDLDNLLGELQILCEYLAQSHKVDLEDRNVKPIVRFFGVSHKWLMRVFTDAPIVVKSDPALSFQPPVSSDLDDDTLSSLCPLEQALFTAGKGSKNHHYDRETFYQWIISASSVAIKLGLLKGVYLHREKGFLHHEYLLLQFGEIGVGNSWIRAERAARMKHHLIQSNSFRPVVGGARLRETISLSASKGDLTTPRSSELVSIQIGAQKDRHSRATKLLLTDAFYTIHSNSVMFA